MKEIEQRSLVTTGDGSRTLFHPGVGEHYHSRHGAVAESRHVFVGQGLDHYLSSATTDAADTVSVLEIGFGTGLNFLLSAAHCAERGVRLDYCGIEAFPLSVDMLEQLDYGQYVDPALWSAFLERYPEAVGRSPADGGGVEISPGADPGSMLEIIVRHVLEVDLGSRRFDVVYFDAFAAVHQPELWTREVFEKVTGWMAEGGVFVTYAITGELKRIMRALGLRIEKRPGAPGKREMLRAFR